VRTWAAAALAAALLLAGCASTASGGGTSQDQTLTVLAASSLTESFQRLGRIFEKQHPGTSVRFSFDSSATLAEQVAQGAPADILATADSRTMQAVVEAGAVTGSPQQFATNTLVLVVPTDNPAQIGSFADLDRPGTSYVVCVESAPCGALAAQQLAAHHITNPPRSREVDVKAVLTKVVLGEADAGLVYATDARAAEDDVDAMPVPGADRHPNTYPIAAVSGSSHPQLAQEWLDLVRSEQGRRVLAAAGFGLP
jgi:molybdate transport system substrate-binding protein